MFPLSCVYRLPLFLGMSLAWNFSFNAVLMTVWSCSQNSFVVLHAISGIESVCTSDGCYVNEKIIWKMMSGFFRSSVLILGVARCFDYWWAVPINSQTHRGTPMARCAYPINYKRFLPFLSRPRVMTNPISCSIPRGFPQKQWAKPLTSLSWEL